MKVTRVEKAEFADDIISLVASYSGRMYGRRGGRKKKVQTDE